MDRLSPLSAAFLSAEDVDPDVSLVIGSFAVLEGPAPTVAELRALVGARLDDAPRYRQRVHRSPLDLRAPGWVDDPGFDLANHVRTVAVPAPGGEAEVAELVGWLMSQRMDHDAPLWDVWLCEGLSHGRWGLLCRLHHALADGMSGTALLRVVYDEAEPAARAATVPQVGHRHAEHSRAVTAAGEAVAAARGALALGRALVPGWGTPLTGHVGSGRRYTWTTVSLPPARPVRKALGVTLNDLVLASVAGGFRELLLARGEDPRPTTMRTLVPVSAWGGRQLEQPENRVTLMLPWLPVDVADPVARVHAVHERIHGLRRSGEPDAGMVAQGLAALVPYPLVAGTTRWALRLPQWQVDTVVTNVPGPRQPLECLGRRVQRMLPYVPIADRIRTGVAAFSYCDELTFGITGDLETVPDLDLLAHGTRAAWDALVGTEDLATT